jgi:hypothetical protein
MAFFREARYGEPGQLPEGKGRNSMTDIGNALRSTSDTLMRDIQVLNDLEAEKRTLEPGDPRLVALATQVEELATRVLRATTVQRSLSEQADDLVASGDPRAPAAPIEDTPREIRLILAEWRDVERDAAGAAPGSPEAAAAATRSSELREEYRRAHQAAEQKDDSRRRRS